MDDEKKNGDRLIARNGPGNNYFIAWKLVSPTLLVNKFPFSQSKMNVVQFLIKMLKIRSAEVTIKTSTL